MQCGFCENGKLYSDRDLHKSGGDYLGKCFRCDGAGFTSIKGFSVDGFRKQKVERIKNEEKRINNLLDNFFKNKDCSYP